MRNTSSASPRYRNVQRAPSMTGTSRRARKRSTAAESSGRRSRSRLIASLRPTGAAPALLGSLTVVTLPPERSRGLQRRHVAVFADRPDAGRPADAINFDPGAALQEDTAGRPEPPSEDRHPGGVVEQQPGPGVG